MPVAGAYLFPEGYKHLYVGHSNTTRKLLKLH